MLFQSDLNRRKFCGLLSSFGIFSALFPKHLWAKYQKADEQKISKSAIQEAETIAGLKFTEAERELMVEGVNENLAAYEKIRTIPLDNSVPPALQFNPILPGMMFETKKLPIKTSRVLAPKVTANLEELAFLPVTHLAQLIKTKRISSLELTKMYLERLKRYDEKLQCVITLTEELALRQATQADKEIAAGKYRGPLHGIPWGAKDLLATKGYRTTWGAMTHKDQMLDYDATVVERLERAGAVLIAKLTMGELAWGDVWFGGTTKNPWNLTQGSSGSSAGPAAATAAGLVGFSIGTETYGSIVSPSTRCGVTGLRPTFGRISRYGAMALSWSMDKIGPICRSVEDCALVFDAIYGPDGKDLTVVNLPFNWNANQDVRKLRIGYLKSAFEADRENNQAKANDEAVLDLLRSKGINLIPIELPDFPVSALRFILNAEAAAAFDDLTRSNRDDLLVRQIKNAWPNVFRHSRLIPAVEYIQANRVRTLIMHAMAKLMSQIDVFVTPSYGGDVLLLTNLTGHPAVVVPNGFNEQGSPTSISFIGKLFHEAETLLVAKTYQDATDFHLKHPNL
ncbi:MAG: amidase [candidate division KSB1 bacterium]|nr:amidase [candidate division KSB1 bacterium]MDZ7334878.1 amidase [candidate division KSB1 bacterium]MDZ7357344.1 amidase [candidate division KSB1 bacterium]MDZ7375861.1 amidase [candidate division KSB1 bacterium]MDZ7399333.1 amidase [candidate division KSB1 bacterium]